MKHPSPQALVVFAVLALGACSTVNPETPDNVPPQAANLEYPDLAAMPPAVEVTPEVSRNEILRDLQNDALRASLSRDVVTLQLSARIPQPLKFPRDPLIPAHMRLNADEARSRLKAPPPPPSQSQLPPTAPAGK